MFILGGAQTDFARRWGREGTHLSGAIKEVLDLALQDAKVDVADIDVTHVGNFVAGEITGQSHLGGLLGSVEPALIGKAAARHEAACASGSVAIQAALAELTAGFHDLACVVGIEEMRSVPGQQAADALAGAAWRGREATDARYAWPFLFDQLMDAVEERQGLDVAHLRAFARQAFDNAKDNPFAQTRGWTVTEDCFRDDPEQNPAIEGRVRRYDCGQVTDGAACVLLASERFARAWASRAGVDLASVPRIAGWGHRTGPMQLAEKFEHATDVLFPHVREAARDARRRAGVAREEVGAFELHDCFSITGYVLLEHLEIAPPGRAFEAIEDGRIARGGGAAVNPGGGLIGLGHPVGATGVRMLLDAARQVTGRAGACQVDGVRSAQTLNIGGSATTAMSFVVRA